MKTKAQRQIEEIEQAGKDGVKENDLFYTHEMSDAIRQARHRIRKTLGLGKKLVIDGGVYFIERTGGVAGFAIMAILVVVMSVLSYNAGMPDDVHQCGNLFNVDINFD